MKYGLLNSEKILFLLIVLLAQEIFTINEIEIASSRVIYKIETILYFFILCNYLFRLGVGLNQ